MLFDKRNEIEIDLTKCEELADLVYLYVEPVTEKKLILKVQEEPLDYSINAKEEEEILFQEFRKLVHLSNEPEIATVNYLVKTNDDRIAYLMEYVEGITLADYLEKNTITLDEAVDIIYHITLAIEKAHSMDVFHNDLAHMKNILVNNMGFIKIIDFLDWTVLKQKESPKNDIESIKLISHALTNKLKEKEDIKIFHEINLYIRKTTKIKNLARNILTVYKTTSDILYLSPYTIRFFLILSNLANEVTKDFNYVKKEFKIEKTKLNIKKGALLENLSASEAIQKKYNMFLIFIEPMGYLGKTKISVQRSDEKFYYYNIVIFFTPKLLKTIHMIKQHNLLVHYYSIQDFGRTIHDYAFLDSDKTLREKLLINYTPKELSEVINMVNLEKPS